MIADAIGWSEAGALAPELALIGAAAAVLAAPLVRGRKNNLVAGATAGIGLFVAIVFLLGVNSWGELAAHPVGTDGGGVGGVFFGREGGGLLVMDPFAWLVKLCILVFALMTVGLWMVATRDDMGEGTGVEFFTLFLTALVGLLLMASTTNLLVMWVAMELAALPGYALVGFGRTQRGGTRRCAALRWALWGMVCSAVMVYGMSLLYGVSGSLDVSALRHLMTGGPRWAVAAGLLGMLVGVGGKVMIAPLHSWAVEALEGASLEVGGLVTVAYMGAGLAMTLRCVVAVGGQGDEWLGLAVLTLGAATSFWGTIAALQQRTIKRLLAYSSMAHGGYMLLAIAMAAGRNASGAVEAWLLYFVAYVFMNGGAFVAAAAIRQRTGAASLSDYAGLSQRCPILAGAMAVMVFSLLGIPLTIGFGVRMKLVELFFAGSGGGHHGIGYAALAALALGTVLGAMGYMRIVRQMYFVKTDLPRAFEIVPATLLATALAVVNIALVVGYGWVEAGVRTFAAMWRG